MKRKNEIFEPKSYQKTYFNLFSTFEEGWIIHRIGKI